MYERQALIFQISSLFQTFYPLSFEEGQTSWEREGVHPHCRPASPFVVHGWRAVMRLHRHLRTRSAPCVACVRVWGGDGQSALFGSILLPHSAGSPIVQCQLLIAAACVCYGRAVWRTS